jgi:hypothetical protein
MTTAEEMERKIENALTRFEPHFDGDGNFIHPCCVCGQHATRGFGVSLRNGRLGTWYCGEHVPRPNPG